MNWEEFLNDHRIDYVTRGPNTKHGEVSVRCPWCGSDDPSQHLGINLATGSWGCLRNQEHRGKSEIRLICGLLACSVNQAELLSRQYSRADPDDLESVLEALIGEKQAPQMAADALEWPPEVRDIPPQGRFYDYLRSRGYDNVEALSSMYGLKCANTGKWHDRILIPVVDSRGAMVAFTGRAINRPVSAPRYLTTSGNAIKEVIFDLPKLTGGKLLFITEGPFDAMKVGYYADSGIHSTCVFGTSITPSQISLLRSVSRNYDTVVILLDSDAVEQKFALTEWLSRGIIGVLPEGVKDPGDLSKQQVLQLIRSYK